MYGRSLSPSTTYAYKWFWFRSIHTHYYFRMGASPIRTLVASNYDVLIVILLAFGYSFLSLIHSKLFAVVGFAAAAHDVQYPGQEAGVSKIEQGAGGEVPGAQIAGGGAVETLLEAENAPH